jgi:hypothetical protein
MKLRSQDPKLNLIVRLSRCSSKDEEERDAVAELTDSLVNYLKTIETMLRELPEKGDKSQFFAIIQDEVIKRLEWTADFVGLVRVELTTGFSFSTTSISSTTMKMAPAKEIDIQIDVQFLDKEFGLVEYEEYLTIFVCIFEK